MIGKAASAARDRLLTTAPLERLSRGRNACVILSAPIKFTASVLFDDVEAAQIVVDGDAGVVDEDIERLDLRDSGLNLRRARHVQPDGGHACIDMVQRAASAGVDSAGSSCERFVDERPPDAPVGSG